LLGLVKVTVEGSVVEARHKAMARSMHNSGNIIHFENLDFLAVNLDWFCHRVMMGHLIKTNDDRAKLSSVTYKDGFTSRAYLEKVLNDSLKYFHDLGYHRSFSYIMVQNLVEFMLKLELCFQRTIGSKNDNKLVMPTSLNIDQGHKSWNWSQHIPSSNLIYFGRRLQCDDQECTFILRSFFCQLQVSYFTILS